MSTSVKKIRPIICSDLSKENAFASKMQIRLSYQFSSIRPTSVRRNNGGGGGGGERELGKGVVGNSLNPRFAVTNFKLILRA